MAPKTNILNVIDLESTCWEPVSSKPDSETQEIIEVGIVEVDMIEREIISKNSFLIKPEHSTVSEFCTELTTITSDLLEEEGQTYGSVYASLIAGYQSKNRIWASWGDWDRIMFEKNPSNTGGLLYPFGRAHLNIKNLHALVRGLSKSTSLSKACNREGIEFEGTAHRGDDDAYNIAKVFLKILE